jgi:hypothetical protein
MLAVPDGDQAPIPATQNLYSVTLFLNVLPTRDTLSRPLIKRRLPGCADGTAWQLWHAGHAAHRPPRRLRPMELRK